MAQPYVGEIRLFAGNFAPAGWQFCGGQLLAISENEALFQLIGTTYGGDGQETFALPDLREFPMALTRNLETAKQWLRDHCDSEEQQRMGLLASAGGKRLRAWVDTLGTGGKPSMRVTSSDSEALHSAATGRAPVSSKRAPSSNIATGSPSSNTCATSSASPRRCRAKRRPTIHPSRGDENAMAWNSKM